MKSFLLIPLFISSSLWSQAIDANSPISLVNRQLKAYNSRAIESFLEPYDDDVEAYILTPHKIAFKGKDEMRNIYTEIFENTANLHCELINRIVQGNTIIDKECAQFGERSIETVVIYTIENEKIKTIYFVN